MNMMLKRKVKLLIRTYRGKNLDFGVMMMIIIMMMYIAKNLAFGMMIMMIMICHHIMKNLAFGMMIMMIMICHIVKNLAFGMIYQMKGRKFLDGTEFPYMKFKTVSITDFQDTTYNFYYQPIIHGIKVLLLQSDVNEEFIYKYRNNDTSAITVKTYGEQYESDWWNVTEKNISIDNYLLSIIIYADSTTCDHLGKTSEHPIYISIGNIPNWMRNKPNTKILVGYLPKLKAKDNTT